MHLPQPEACFRKMEAEFADKPGSRAQLYLAIGGLCVRLSFTSAAVPSAWLRPWLHLTCPSQKSVDLEVEVLSAPAQKLPDAVYFCRSDDGDYALQMLPRSLAVFRGSPPKILVSRQPSKLLSLYELGRPLHALLALWLNARGRPLLHSALVALNGHGALIAGASGKGKTTTALACLEAGWSFLGDDLTILEVEEGASAFRGHSLYATTFLTPDRRRLATFLGRQCLPPRLSSEEKCLTYLHPGQRRSLLQSVPIQLLAIPDPDPVAQRLSPAQALLALAPSTLLVGPLSAGRRGLDAMAELVQAVPAYQIPWSCDLPRTLAELTSGQ